MFALAIGLGLIVQVGKPIVGTVVDSAGKPVAGASLSLSLGRDPDGVVPTLARGETDGAGRFALEPPSRERLDRANDFWGAIWARVPGRVISGVKWSPMVDADSPVQIVLPNTSSRTITLGDEAGGRVAPLSIFRRGLIYGAVLPDDLVEALKVPIQADGRAEFREIPDDTQVLAVELETRDARLVVGFGRGLAASTGRERSLQTRPLGRLAGRVIVPEGRSVNVELWAREMGPLALMAPARLAAGPIALAADGSFLTPPLPTKDMAYRVVVRVQGLARTLSPWVKPKGETTQLPTVEPRPSREIAGRVVDRQGRPLPGVAVFQSGDGPERTATTTDAAGRFRLGGYRVDRGFVFARKAGHRFQGRVVTAGADDVTITLTRDDEPAERSMTTLEGPLPRAESFALARRLIDPYLARALRDGNDGDRFRALFPVIHGDPAAALEIAEGTTFQTPRSLDTIRSYAARVLAQNDLDEAAAVVETIATPGGRAEAFVDVVTELGTSQPERQIDLLDRALLQARAAEKSTDKPLLLASIAECLFERGQVDKAKALLREARVLDADLPDKQDATRAFVAGRLALADPRGAIDIARELQDPEWRNVALGNIAVRLATVDPAEAERVLGMIEHESMRGVAIQKLCRTLARTDPTRARALALASGHIKEFLRLHSWLFLAEGAAASNRELALEAFRKFEAELEVQGEHSHRTLANPAAIALPLVEAIDPGLVPQVFWRALALRLPDAEPRAATGIEFWDAELPTLLARYDREAASVAFAPMLDQARAAVALGDAHASILASTLAMIDPRAAVDLLESGPPIASVSANDNWARVTVAEHLARSPASRWKSIWRLRTGLGLTMYDRDVR